MKQAFYLMLLAPFFMMGCGGGAFKKTEKGTEYKIIAKGSGEKLKYGDFFEFTFSYSYKDSKKDSLMVSSVNSINGIALLDTVQSNTPGYIYKMFAQCRKGDSVVMKVLVDSAYMGGTMPPGFNKGGFIVSGYRIVRVFKDKAEADSAQKQLQILGQQKAIAKEKEQLVKDDKTIADYLAKNKITATKAPGGTYVQIISQGNGPLIDTSVEARVNYTGRTMAGKMFDSNTDTSLNRLAPPYPVRMWAPEVIRGWVDGLGLLSKGAKAKFYIPSGLAYGPQSPGSDIIGPNEILVFDIEVADVLSKAQSMALMKEEQKKAEQQQKQMEQMRKRYEDSVAKANKKMMDTAKKAK